LLNIGVCLSNRNPYRHAQKLTILKQKNANIFWGGGYPLPDPTPLGAVSIFAPTALKLNVTPPEKNPSYGVERSSAEGVPITKPTGRI